MGLQICRCCCNPIQVVLLSIDAASGYSFPVKSGHLAHCSCQELGDHRHPSRIKSSKVPYFWFLYHIVRFCSIPLKGFHVIQPLFLWHFFFLQMWSVGGG